MRVTLKRTEKEWEKIKKLSGDQPISSFITLQLRKTLNDYRECLINSEEENEEKSRFDYTIPSYMQKRLVCISEHLSIPITQVIYRIALYPHLKITAQEHLLREEIDSIPAARQKPAAE